MSTSARQRRPLPHPTGCPPTLPASSRRSSASTAQHPPCTTTRGSYPTSSRSRRHPEQRRGRSGSTALRVASSAAGPVWEDNDLVFAQPNRRPIDRKSDWHACKQLLTEAGVREVRLHDGLRTAATLLSEGAHPRVVMEVLDHSQMRTTTDTYSH